MRLYLILLLLFVASCNEKPAVYYKTGYDDELFRLIEMEAQTKETEVEGSSSYCAAILKIDGSDYPGLFLGKCGGTDALLFENALMSSDPETITNDYGLSIVDKFPERKAIFLDIARYRVQKRCSEPKPPASCSAKSPFQKLGL
jgi:hypothetical protein